MTNQVNVSNLVNLILARLVQPDTSRTHRAMSDIIERAHTQANTGATTKTMGISITEPEVLNFLHRDAANNSSSFTPNYVTVTDEMRDEVIRATNDILQTNKEFQAMRRSLAQLLHGIQDAQTIRNTLPEYVYNLVSAELPYQRTADELITVRDNPLRLREVEQTLPLFKAYAAASVLMEN